MRGLPRRLMTAHTKIASIGHMPARKTRGYSHFKPAFHGACFGADSAPILSARNTRRASDGFDKYASRITHVSIGADCRAD